MEKGRYEGQRECVKKKDTETEIFQSLEHSLNGRGVCVIEGERERENKRGNEGEVYLKK